MKITTLLLSVGLLTCSQSVLAFQYAISEVGISISSKPNAFNNIGQIIGYTNNGKAALWENGNIHILESLSDVYAINNLGEIAGSTTISQTTFKPAILRNGNLTILDALEGEGGVATGMNDNGQIIGLSYKSSQLTYPATLWNNGTPTELPGFTSDVIASVRAINNSGQVIGYSDKGQELLWKNGNTTVINEMANVKAINNDGIIVGDSYSQGYFQASVWIAGQVTVLSGPIQASYYAYDVNDLGVIVGSAEGVAVFWENGVLHDLNTLIDPASGWTLTSAYNINEAGQIIGQGIMNNRPSYFMLTPVPEPSSYALLLLGLGLVGNIARQRKPQHHLL